MSVVSQVKRAAYVHCIALVQELCIDGSIFFDLIWIYTCVCVCVCVCVCTYMYIYIVMCGVLNA